VDDVEEVAKGRCDSCTHTTAGHNAYESLDREQTPSIELVSLRHIELLTFPGLVRLAEDRCEVFITMLADAGENRSSDARGTVPEPTAITSSK
jgi:hypothetical protein